MCFRTQQNLIIFLPQNSLSPNRINKMNGGKKEPYDRHRRCSGYIVS